MDDGFEEGDELFDFLADRVEVVGEAGEDGDVGVVDAADFVEGFAQLAHLFVVGDFFGSVESG